MSPIPPIIPLFLIKLLSFSCPERNKLLDCSVGSIVLFSKQNERCERQYCFEPPPAFALLRQGSPSFKSRHSSSYSNPLSRSRNIYIDFVHLIVHFQIRIRSRISIFLKIIVFISKCVIMNQS